MKLSDLAWPEVREYLKNSQTLIIPVGTCEQHGKHMPLNTDILVVEYMADYLSQRTGILVAPTINYGVNLPCDKLFAGTCSLSEGILNKTLLSIVEWWEMQGFKNFLVLTYHGDPFHVNALSETPKNIHLLPLYTVGYQDILEKQTAIKHACEAETSVMLYLYPDKVRTDKIEDFDTPIDTFLDYALHIKTDAIAGSPGNQGYPSFATREKGETIVSRMKEMALAWVNRLL